MTRRRVSRFPKLLDRLETFRKADTRIRAQKYLAARAEVVEYVRQLEQRVQYAERVIESMSEMLDDGADSVRLARFLYGKQVNGRVHGSGE